jgi:hypothetical protein
MQIRVVKSADLPAKCFQIVVVFPTLHPTFVTYDTSVLLWAAQYMYPVSLPRRYAMKLTKPGTSNINSTKIKNKL